MTDKHPKTIDDYIAGFPTETQQRLQEVRAVIQEAAPEAIETISYAIPTFKLGSHYLIYFAGYKKHIGVYPVPTGDKELDEAFANYKTSGKGAIQFPLKDPLPVTLLKKIVAYRLKEAEKKPTGTKP